jgi:hypothetical protein
MNVLVTGAKGDGDVYNPENISSFTSHVLEQTKVGVHFMMADGVRTNLFLQYLKCQHVLSALWEDLLKLHISLI